MATILGVAGNSSYGSQVSVNVSGIAGSGRTGIVCTSVNGPSYGTTSAHAVSGFTTKFSVVGTAFNPGFGVFYGPLDGVTTVTAIAAGGATHSDIAVFAVDDADFDSASLVLSSLTSGYKGGAGNDVSTTFPNQPSQGGWIGILGTGNQNRVVDLTPLTEDFKYDGSLYSALHAFAGGIPVGGFNSQPGVFSINTLDNYSVMTLTWLDAGGSATAPGVPTSVVASPGDSQVSLSWNAPASDGGSPITSYEVEYNESGGSNTLITGAISPEIIGSLTNDILHEFRVRAINAVGPGPWGTDSATPTSGGAPTVPGTPVDFSAFPGDGQISLSWSQGATGGSPITSYDIDYRVSPAGGWTSIADISPALGYVVTSLSNGTAYDFTIRATNAIGDSNWVSEITSTPVAPGGGGGNWPIHIDLGQIEMIDWWEWSWDSNNNDAFQVKARASGPDHYASVNGSGSQNGTSPSNAWSIWTAKSQIDSRALAAGAKVHLAPGDYPVIGQFTGGGSGTSGWVSIVGPPKSQGVAQIRGPYDRYWSMAGSASRIQFVRLHAENPNMATDFNNYVGGGGGGQPNDDAMSSQLGYRVDSIGFQLDGSGFTYPGPIVTVSCSARGVGEGFGSYLAGNYFALGCLAEDCAIASPNGRAGFSFSYTTAGAGVGSGTIDNLVLNQAGTVGFYMGTFACVATHTAQMIDSSGIGASGDVWDGNGFNLPTDAQSSESGNCAQQCNISINVGMQGFNSYNGIDGSLYCINNLSMFAGAHAYHRAGNWIMGYNPNLILNTPQGTGWPYLFHRYPEQFNLTPGQKPYHVAGNVSIHDPNTPSFSQAGFNSTWSAGVNYVTNRGNVSSTSVNDSINAVVSSPSALLETSTRDHYAANLRPKSGSPIIGAAYGADLVWNIDFMGLPFVDRGNGRVDAGIYGGNTGSPVSATIPDPPTALNAVAGNGEVDLSWSAPGDDGGATITSYSAEYRNLTDGGAWTSGGVTVATSRTVNGLTNGKLYEFRVLATNSVGNSAWSGTDQATPVGVASPPFAPSNLVATPGDGQVSLTWSVPDSNGSTITGYVEEHNNGGAWSVNTGIINPSVVVPGLTNGVQYFFRVKATSSEGDSPYSLTVSATPQAVVTTTVPDPPTSFSAVANGTGTPAAGYLDASWTPPGDDGGSPITGYTIHAEGPPGTTTVWNPGVVTSYSNFASPTGVDRDYWVTALNSVGESAPSNIVSESTFSVPGVVQSLVATPGNAEVVLNWSAPLADGDRAVTSYNVEYRVSGGTWALHDSPSTPTSTVTGLANGVAYNFRVAAVNTVGAGPTTQVNGTPSAGMSSSYSGAGLILATLTSPVSLEADFAGSGELIPGTPSSTIQLSASFSGSNFLIADFRASMNALLAGLGTLQGLMESPGTTQVLAQWDGSQWVFGDLMLRGASTWDPVDISTYDGTTWEP